MARIEIILPAMGEGIIEAEITRWLVAEGDPVALDQPLVEVATDKVDSEIPSPADGVIHKILLGEGESPKVGQVMAVLNPNTGPGTAEASPADEVPAGVAPEHEGSDTGTQPGSLPAEDPPVSSTDPPADPSEPVAEVHERVESGRMTPETMARSAFLSPLIKKMALQHQLPLEELLQIPGSGMKGRITREDLVVYLRSRPERRTENGTPEDAAGESQTAERPARESRMPERPAGAGKDPVASSRKPVAGPGEQVREMDRMRKLIADHMVYSKQVAPHVTSFVEADLTNLVHWRKRIQTNFMAKYGEKLTFTALIMEAVSQCLRKYPDINVSVDGYHIVRKTSINIGMATALPDGNLIVPIIRNADQLSLAGMARTVNDLASRARTNQLKPAEIQGGTFTVTNLGQFGNIAGTPVINQPEVAILAVGTLQKKPAVVETPYGDSIGIRHLMILSMAYDHRVVDGTLGGGFLKALADRLQQHEPDREI